MATRLALMQQIDPYVGVYFSKAWIKKHVLHFDEEGIERMETELADEAAAEPKPEAPTVDQTSVAAPTQPDINTAFDAQVTK